VVTVSCQKIPAVFMRGGTSKGVFFHERDLPKNTELRDEIFLSVLGSPDPYGRQLNGLGGGISSLSKVVVVSPSTRSEVDVDYKFGQVSVGQPLVERHTTCGNLASAVGPFAVDEGLVAEIRPQMTVRIWDSNTGRMIISRFQTDRGLAAVDGALVVPGVAGTGAPIELDFLDPGGAVTGKLLPTGNASDFLEVEGVGRIRVSMIDATDACVFVRARDVGLTATELPARLESDASALARLENIRAAAGIAMGLESVTRNGARQRRSSPKIGIVEEPRSMQILSGQTLPANAMDLSVRMLSMGNPHRAIPLTGGMCLSVAAKIEGSIVEELISKEEFLSRSELRLGSPSGVVPFRAQVRCEGKWIADKVTAYRTARRLMEGSVFVTMSGHCI
jgi:2-methylaconitate cis-trans-isomerase PrpF